MFSAKDLVNHWEKTASLGAASLVAIPNASAALGALAARAVARDDAPSTLQAAGYLGALNGLVGSGIGLSHGSFSTRDPRNRVRNALIGASIGGLAGAGVGALAGRAQPTRAEKQEIVDNALKKFEQAGIPVERYLDEDASVEESAKIEQQLNLSPNERYLLSI